MKQNLVSAGTKSLSDFSISRNPRAPHADVTNAPELFGDIMDYGDMDDDDDMGDIDDDDDFGDIDYGDPSPLGLWQVMSGDPARNRRRAGRVAAGLGAGAVSALAVRAMQKRRRAKRANQLIRSKASSGTLGRARAVARNVDGLRRNTMMPFFFLSGGKLNSSPINPNSKFVTDEWKYMLDKQAMETPFLQETAIGAFGAGYVCTANSPATPTFYSALILQIGTNAQIGRAHV